MDTMIDRDKTIKGLEALYKAMQDNQCYTCSHEFIDVMNKFGDEIVFDAIMLLKEDKIKKE